MISSLGSSIVSLYARALGSSFNLVDVMEYEFTIDNEDDLITDLEKDPFICSALSSVLCEVYYKYGIFFSANHGGFNFGETFQNKNNSCLDNKYDVTGSTTRDRDAIERGNENTD